jgi:rhodanese-related sulfurtransferase
MRFKMRIDFLVAALLVFQTVAVAYQKVDLSGMKHPDKEEQFVKIEFITPEELKTKIAKNEPLAILDLRSQNSYEQSDKKIKGSLHTRVRKVATRLREIPRDKEVITYCACPADQAAILAARELLTNGFTRVRVLKGGWDAWLQAGGPVQPKPRGA